jgi:hypothetical protein
LANSAGGMRKNGRGRVSESSFKKTKQRLQNDRWKARLNGVTNDELPDRGELDYIERTHPGIRSTKLEYDILEDELYMLRNRPAYMGGSGDIRTLADAAQIRRVNMQPNLVGEDELASSATIDADRAVKTGSVKDRNITGIKIARGAIEDEHVSGLSAGKVSRGYKARDVDYGGKAAVPIKAVRGEKNLARKSDIPKTSQFAKKSEVAKLKQQIRSLRRSRDRKDRRPSRQEKRDDNNRQRDN